MSLLNIIVLAIVQGLAELLPVSSSAHVVVTEKLLGLDPSSPPMTLLLVMLHTGTMLAVIAYFWPQWRATYFRGRAAFRAFVGQVIVATCFTALVGEAIVKIIEKTLWRNVPHAEIEDLFSHLEFIAPALAIAGVLILVAGVFERRHPVGPVAATHDVTLPRAGVIGAVQGLCLPFRGFSRSGATISAGLLLGVVKSRAEAFSFALAVVLTPPVVAREVLRLARAAHAGGVDLRSAAVGSVLGALVAFVAGLLALRWLSRWLEAGRWYWFGVYCLVAATAVMLLHRAGY
ncbi:MAG TPA: undecaprenyl-diphosphate phosphatase [Steroidobacteraceae bacterium]|nr:undecaprenyl-diphosphate phosphatase [Steroidobacteraceae bacterium]